MVFSSYEFIFLFLPFVVLVYYLLSSIENYIYQHAFLILASLFFYGYFNVSYLFLIISSVIINYSLAKIMTRTKESKPLFIIGILFNIGLLSYFKYYDFFIHNINTVFQTSFNLKYILLPLGISFFTFQQFSFLLSVYKKKEKVERFIDYSLFVTFFPQLVAGPIVTYSEMMPQFKDMSRRYLNTENFSVGVFIFTIGLFKKIVIADTLATFVNNGYNMTYSLGTISALVTVLSYSFQIYFDFCGYSEMAIGLGKMFNINLPLNFNRPYLSLNVKEFWNRWHMTLGRALGSYIYIPLGGNRKGKIRTYVNLMVTFLVSGLWHGAAWTFVVWGGLHGVASTTERVFDTSFKKIKPLIRQIMTFTFVTLAWVLFRATSWTDAINVYLALFSLDFSDLYLVNSLVYDGVLSFPAIFNYVYAFGFIFLSAVFAFKLDRSAISLEKVRLTTLNMLLISMMLVISVVHLSRVSQFIYFNF